MFNLGAYWTPFEGTSLNISGSNTGNASGATATLALTGGTAGETVTLTNGVVRADRSTLFITPTSVAGTPTLGASEKVFPTVAPTLTNGIVSPWTIINLGSKFVSNGVTGDNRFNFATYTGNGYGVATYTQSGSGSSGGIRVSKRFAAEFAAGNKKRSLLQVWDFGAGAGQPALRCETGSTSYERESGLLWRRKSLTGPSRT